MRLEPFARLEFAVSDAATGIAAAVEQVAAERRGAAAAEPKPPLDHSRDVFHTAHEANCVLAQPWRRAEAAWDQAAAADAKVARAKQQGVEARSPAQTARPLWRKATAVFEEVERREAAWRRAEAAWRRADAVLDLFRPDGPLNDRATAEAEIAAALKELPGPDWTMVRHFHRDRRRLAFLDRRPQRLTTVEPRPAWRTAWAWRW
jgi:hypothetical protein